MAGEAHDSQAIMAAASRSLADQRAGGRRGAAIGYHSAQLRRTDLVARLRRTAIGVAGLVIGVMVAGMVIGGIRIDAPAGRGYLITEAGALVPATGRVMASQVASSAAPGVSSSTACFGGAASRKLQVHLDHVVPRGRWFIRIHYTRSGGEVVELNYPGAVYLPKGSGTVLAHLPALTAVSTIVMTTKKPSTLCESANVETPVAAGR